MCSLRSVLNLLDKYSFCWGDCCEFIAPDVWGLGRCLIVRGVSDSLRLRWVKKGDQRVAALSARPLMGSLLSLPDPGSALESIQDPAFRSCPARLLAYLPPLRWECPASELGGRHLSRQHAQHSQTSIWECSQLDWERGLTISKSSCQQLRRGTSRKL